MKTSKITYLAAYKEKKRVMCLYQAYLRSYYSPSQLESFRVELAYWYNDRIVPTDMSDEELEEAFDCFFNVIQAYY